MSKQAKKDRGIRAKGMKVLETMPAKKSASIKIYNFWGGKKRDPTNSLVATHGHIHG